MSEPEDDIDAALLAAGALTARELEAVLGRRKADPAFARATDDWERALAPIASHLTPIEPPDGLLAKIDARLDQGETKARNQTVRAAEGEWTEMGPGIRIKMLHQNAALRRQTIVLVADPGAVHPAHLHDFDEEIFVVSGDITIDGEELGPGDYHYSPATSRHPAETTRKGCTCVITTGF
jgi:anti-sigma factor ChrR (cupin superfamily)